MVNSAFFKTTVSLLLVISSFCLHSTTEDNNGWIPINGEYGSLVLNVKINGHPAKVLLDTGASIHTLSSKIVSEANIKSNNARELKLIGLNGEVRAPLSGSFDITADGQTFTLRDIPIVKQNSSFDMILGRDFFEQSVVQIDYPNQRIRFISPEAVNFSSNIGVRYEYGGGLLLESYIQGEKAWMLLDTGSNTMALLKRKFVFKNDLNEFVLDGVDFEVSGISETGEFKVLNLDGFSLGPYNFDSFLAIYNRDYKNAFDRQKKYLFSRIPEESSVQDGILGYEILRNFVVTLDYKRKKVHLFLPRSS